MVVIKSSNLPKGNKNLYKINKINKSFHTERVDCNYYGLFTKNR